MAINNCLEKIIRSIDSIPPFPQVAMRVLEIAKDPDAGAADIVDVLQYDQAVTANCLKLCNSSYFGLREKVRSLQHAVVLLGTGNLTRIVIADCCRLSAFSAPQTGYDLAPGQLWHHSMSCALVSQVLAGKLGCNDGHELFTAALLHDIGKLVIDRFVADNFEAMFQLMQDKGYGMVETEKAYFGIDHAELGGVIAKIWGFPESLTTAIKHHHRLDLDSATPNMVSLTALSNLAAHVFCDDPPTNAHEHIRYGIDPNVLSAFRLSPEDMTQMGSEFSGEINKAEALLKMAA